MLLFTSKDVCVVCMRSRMIGLYGTKTWPVKKENELTLQRAEMRMIGYKDAWILKWKV